jgi:hypothetical protein
MCIYFFRVWKGGIGFMGGAVKARSEAEPEGAEPSTAGIWFFRRLELHKHP